MADARRIIVQTLSEFCLETSIHGFYFIVYSRQKIFWSVLTIATISVCIWQCSLNVLQYFDFEIKTTITTENFDLADFPAIDFCPEHTLKRRTIASVEKREFVLAALFEENENDFSKLVLENVKSCKPTSNDKITFEHAVNDVKNTSTYFNGKYTTNFQDVLLQCKWKNEPFDCRNAFMDHLSYGVRKCFVFNQGDQMVSILSHVHIGGNINVSAYKEKNFQVDSVQPTLQLTMRINQSNQCGNDIIKRGSGISFSVFGKRQFSVELVNTYTGISPGFETDVTLQMVKYNRNTEHLGRCVKSRSLYIMPNVTFYYRSLCFAQCGGELQIESCGCLSPQLLPFQESFKAYYQNVNTCISVDEVKCLKKLLLNVLTSSYVNYRGKCRCPIPCDEEFYNVHVTTSLLRKDSFNRDTLRNVSYEEFRKNYLAIKFRFATMTTEIVEESQAFTRQDMFIYLGNNIGMLLGMSFTSCFEVGYIVVRVLQISLKRLASPKKFLARLKKVIRKKFGQCIKRKVHPIRQQRAIVIHL